MTGGGRWRKLVEAPAESSEERARDIPDLIGDSASYAVGKAIPGVLGLATVVVFVRLIGREEYGKYALAFTIAQMASVFFTGWLTQALLRYYSDVRLAPAIRRTVWRGLAVASAAGVVVLGAGVATGLLGQLAAPGLTAVLALFLTSNVYQLRTALLQAELRPRAVMLLHSAQAVVALAAPLVLFLTAGRTYLAAVAGVALSYALASVWRSRESEGPVSAASPTSLTRLWAYGWSLSLWFAVTAMLLVSDRYLIERSFGFAATGSYAAVYDVIVRAYSLLLFPVTLAVHPRMMALWNAGEQGRAWALWRWAMGAQVAAAAVLLVAFAAFSGRAVQLILPAAGEEAPSLAVPLVIGGFLWQFALLAHKPLELAGRTGLMLMAAMVSLGINLTANILLLPRYGIQVAAYAMVASGVAYGAIVLPLGAMVHRFAPRADS